MTLYVINHTPIGDTMRSYDGTDRATVEKLEAEYGNPYDIVDEATYNAKVAALPVKAILEPK